ncbi:alpha/beta hydrolase [Geodermatophilus sabuli]|uniref:Alpha/beta hydrolase n=1 Tax=Geodermatophilus sabuli TaxID=1564158 RepID=A0A7K3VX14_9ACTN|nr:alpha/beta hydrolase [Geodermatophilus sabuli]
MTTFVLVHGAWGGAHGFRHVRRMLSAAAQEVFTPGLTGIGERVHLVSPQVRLGTHVADVVNLVRYEDLDDIVLVGFSYGGMVVTGALDAVGDRVRHLVYLDAFVPADGDSLYGLVGAPATGLQQPGEPWLVEGPQRRYDDPAEAAFSAPRRTPHPVGCFTEPVRLSRPLEEWPFTRTYVRATADEPGVPANPAFEAAAARARASEAWHHREIDTTHLVPQNRPRELTDLLLELA